MDKKRVISIMLVLLMTLFAFAGCGGKGGGSDADPADVESLKTIGDAVKLAAGEEDQWAVYDGKVVYVFKYGDTYYRVRAGISEEDQQAYFDIDFADEDYEEKQHAIVDPLEIEQIEDLGDQLLSDDDLAALAGKTGKEMVEAGWVYSGSYNLDDNEVWMEYGPFEYSVKYEGTFGDPESDDFDIEEATADMKVKSVEFSTLGDATDID